MRATIALPTAEQAVNMWTYLESGASDVVKSGGNFEAFLLEARDALKQTFDPSHVDHVFHRFNCYVVDLCKAISQKTADTNTVPGQSGGIPTAESK
jgi:hypothetical protein